MLEILWFVLGWLSDEEFSKYMEAVGFAEPITREEFYKNNFIYWEEGDINKNDIMFVLNLINERKKTNE